MSDTFRKSVLIELARLDNEHEQLRLWEEIKSGQLVTVRAARERKVKHRSPRPVFSKALENSKRLLLVLSLLEKDEATMDEIEYRQLIDLYKEIGIVLNRLEASSRRISSG